MANSSNQPSHPLRSEPTSKPAGLHLINRLRLSHDRGPPKTAAAFATVALAAEIGVVHLDPSRQTLCGVPLHHHLHQFVLDFPGRGLGDPKPASNSMLEMPPLLWVRWYMARNQVPSTTLVAAKIVPAIKDVCRRQAVHW